MENNEILKSRKYCIDVYAHEIAYVVDFMSVRYENKISKFDILLYKPCKGSDEQCANITVIFLVPVRIGAVHASLNMFLDTLRGIL